MTNLHFYKGKVFSKSLSLKTNFLEISNVFKNYKTFKSYIKIYIFFKIKENEEVLQFRNDQPLELVISAALEEKEDVEESTKDIATSGQFRQVLKQTIPASIKTQNSDNVNLNKQKTNQIIKLNFEIHPLIESWDYLRRPFIILDPRGDRIYGELLEKSFKRGGLAYYKPVGWERFGLKVSLLGYGESDWLAKDGNPNEWAVGYHGIMAEKYLKKILINLNGKFEPHFQPGVGQKFQTDKNKNKLCDSQNCGVGIYFSNKIESAQTYSRLIHVDKNLRYKVVLQCRLNPAKINIPTSASDTYIVQKSEDIRPYGILIRTFTTNTN
jgi:hypothetical protein